MASDGFESGFRSSVSPISIPNTHLIGQGQGKVLRGKAPQNEKEVAELVKYGITDVVIFKNDTRGEVATEQKLLLDQNLKPSRVVTIPFRWKEFGSFEEACVQTVEAMKHLKYVESKPGRGVFFHCTVGEDRTGYLAGLYRMLYAKNAWDMKRAFDDELCARGYEAGNPKKPQHVVDAIRQELTPLFMKMAYKIETGEMKGEALTRKICRKDPANEAAFRDNPRYRAENYVCRKSPNYALNTH